VVSSIKYKKITTFYTLCSVYLGHLPPKAGQEPDKLGEYRRKLIDFLENSKHYLPERLLTRFPIE
jgi:hypothetical protein